MVGNIDGIGLCQDVGTNIEVSPITAGGHISSLSCASGPAFEGYQIRHGMRAAPDAVDRVSITSSDLHYTTIDNLPPVGMCGSGILGSVAQLSRVAAAVDD